MEIEFQNPERISVPHLAVRMGALAKPTFGIPSAGANDEWRELPLSGSAFPSGILRSKALVVVIVSVYDYVGSRGSTEPAKEASFADHCVWSRPEMNRPCESKRP